MNRLIPSFLALVLSVLWASQALGGGDSSGGADEPAPATGAAWFLGTSREVRACIAAASDYGFTTVELERDILEAYDTWKNYVRSRSIEEFHGQPIVQDYYRLNFNIRFMPACDGSEDLKFYFGVSGPEVAGAKNDFNDPIAFVHRNSYDALEGSGKGFMWVDRIDGKLNGFLPPESRDDALKIVLLHEIGHILGCEHVAGTVMDPALMPGFVRMSIKEYAKKSRMIDYTRQLRTCVNCLDMIESGPAVADQYPVISPADFRRFTGRAPVGGTYLKFHVQNGTSMSFELIDSSGAVSVPVKTDPSLIRPFETGQEPRIFRVYRTFVGDVDYVAPVRFGGSSAMLTGQIQDYQQHQLDVILMFNVGTALSADIVENGGTNALFRSVPL